MSGLTDVENAYVEYCRTHGGSIVSGIAGFRAGYEVAAALSAATASPAERESEGSRDAIDPLPPQTGMAASPVDAGLTERLEGFARVLERGDRLEWCDGIPFKGQDFARDLRAVLKALSAQAAGPESGSTGVWTNQDPSPPSPLLGLSGIGREEIARAAEAIILRRQYRNRIDGYTLEMGVEIADAILALQGVSS